MCSNSSDSSSTTLEAYNTNNIIGLSSSPALSFSTAATSLNGGDHDLNQNINSSRPSSSSPGPRPSSSRDLASKSNHMQIPAPVVYTMTAEEEEDANSPWTIKPIEESLASRNAVAANSDLNSGSGSGNGSGDGGAGGNGSAGWGPQGQKRAKMHPCELCGKRFPRPSGLSTHMNSHSGAKRKLFWPLSSLCDGSHRF